jgi:hypothetical protein
MISCWRSLRACFHWGAGGVYYRGPVFIGELEGSIIKGHFTLRASFHVWGPLHTKGLLPCVGQWVAGPQKEEAPPKWVETGGFKSIYFICTEMGGAWVVLETSILVF